MNILHVFNEYLPKTEVWAHELIRHCTGVQHFVVADYYAHLDTYEDGVTILNRKKGLISKKRAQHSQYNFPKKLFQAVYVIGDKLSSNDSLGHLIEKNNIDIVHIHFGTTAIERWNELKEIKKNIIISFYGWDYAKAIYHNPSYKKIYKDIFRKTSLLLTEGNAGKNRLIELGASSQHIKSLPLGITIKQQARKRSFKEDGVLRLVQVASLSEKKGQLITIQAFQKALIKCQSRLQLCLVGDDREISYAKDIRSKIIEQDLSDAITHIEWIDFNKLDDFLDDFDIFIHPSQHAANGDCEGGAPVILLHAQALGLPIISTTHCDIPEQVIHEQTGFLSEEGQVEGIADHIVRFSKMQADTYNKMVHQAKKHIATHFDVVQIGQRLKQYYKESSSKQI